MISKHMARVTSIVIPILTAILLILGCTILWKPAMHHQQQQDNERNTAIENQVAKTHYAPTTLTDKVVIKTFNYNPYISKNDNSTVDANIGIQVGRYLNSITNLKDYQVNQTYHPGTFFHETSTTVTLTKK